MFGECHIGSKTLLEYMVGHDDHPHLVMINRVGFPQLTLQTFKNFSCFKDGGLGLLRIPIHLVWKSPIWMNEK